MDNRTLMEESRDAYQKYCDDIGRPFDGTAFETGWDAKDKVHKQFYKLHLALNDRYGDALRLIERIDEMLRVPAAEYVPAIGDVFDAIDAFKKAHSQDDSIRPNNE